MGIFWEFPKFWEKIVVLLGDKIIYETVCIDRTEVRTKFLISLKNNCDQYGSLWTDALVLIYSWYEDLLIVYLLVHFFTIYFFHSNQIISFNDEHTTNYQKSSI